MPGEASNYHHTVFHGQFDAISVLVTTTMALSLYNCLELLLWIFTTFNKWKGLYFWALTVSTLGTISYCNGLLIEYFMLTKVLVGLVLDNIGWMTMITGQSLVLYSRLGLILSDQRILRWVLWMIITDAIIFHTITTVLNFGARYGGGHPFIRGYFYIENIQMTIFCLQEFIISGIYVWQTIKLLKVISKQRTRLIMWQLFTINVIIVGLDIVLLAIQYNNLHLYEQSIKAFVYSVKLKLEFAILGKLVDLVQSGQRRLPDAMGTVEDAIERADTSPTRERNSSFASFPWFQNREKLPIQHIEHKEVEHEETGQKPHEHQANGHMSNGSVNPGQHQAGDVSMRINSGSSGRRPTGCESDVMYADIMRAVSHT